jgi:hypothetical protein
VSLRSALVELVENKYDEADRNFKATSVLIGELLTQSEATKVASKGDFEHKSKVN